MSHKNILFYLGSFVVLSLGFQTSSLRAQQVGEQGDNSVSIIALCDCVATAETATSPQCQRQIAQFRASQEPAPQPAVQHGFQGFMQPQPTIQ